MLREPPSSLCPRLTEPQLGHTTLTERIHSGLFDADNYQSVLPSSNSPWMYLRAIMFMHWMPTTPACLVLTATKGTLPGNTSPMSFPVGSWCMFIPKPVTYHKNSPTFNHLHHMLLHVPHLPPFSTYHHTTDCPCSGSPCGRTCAISM